MRPYTSRYTVCTRSAQPTRKNGKATPAPSDTIKSGRSEQISLIAGTGFVAHSGRCAWSDRRHVSFFHREQRFRLCARKDDPRPGLLLPPRPQPAVAPSARPMSRPGRLSRGPPLCWLADRAGRLLQGTAPACASRPGRTLRRHRRCCCAPPRDGRTTRQMQHRYRRQSRRVDARAAIAGEPCWPRSQAASATCPSAGDECHLEMEMERVKTQRRLGIAAFPVPAYRR